MQHPYRRYLQRVKAERSRQIETLQSAFEPIYRDNRDIQNNARDALRFPKTANIVEFATHLPRKERKNRVTLTEFITGQPQSSHGRLDPVVQRHTRGWLVPDAYKVVERDTMHTTPVIFTAHGMLFHSFVPSPADPESTFGVNTTEGVHFTKVFPTYATSTDELYRFFQGDQLDVSRRHLGQAMLQLSLGIH